MTKHEALRILIDQTQFNLNDYYVISIYDSEVKLQGHLNQASRQTCVNGGVDFRITPANGFLEGIIIINDLPITVTLTYN